MIKKTNHIAAVIAATHAALGVDADRPAAADADSAPQQPSRLAAFASRPPAKAPRKIAKPAKGSTGGAVAALAKAPW